MATRRQGSDQITPLMRASMGADPGEWDGEDAFDGKPRTVKSLLKKGADPNETDGEKRTALHYAAMVGARTCVSLLLAAGARRDLRDKYRQTPLDLARENTHLVIEQLLAEDARNVRPSRKLEIDVKSAPGDSAHRERGG